MSNNSINSNIPIEITKGGTAAVSFVAYTPVCGGTGSGSVTTPLQSVASIGSATQVLTSQGTSALPQFATAPTTSMIFQVVASDPGSPSNGQVWYNSTSNTFKGFINSATKTFTVS